MKSICVYSSSSDAISKGFFDVAVELGTRMAEDGYTLVYGGGCIGLMGALAKAIHAHDGKVLGVIPGFMRRTGVCYEDADELIVTSDMRERKAAMEEESDAFIGMPGGFGTLEEMLEIITLKQLGQHSKAIVFLNVNGFYDPLKETFEHIYREHFAKEDYRQLYYFAPDVDSAMKYLKAYKPSAQVTKWFDPLSHDE